MLWSNTSRNSLNVTAHRNRSPGPDNGNEAVLRNVAGGIWAEDEG